MAIAMMISRTRAAPTNTGTTRPITVTTSPTHAMGIPPLSDQWLADERRPAYPAPCALLERPPKRLLIV